MLNYKIEREPRSQIDLSDVLPVKTPVEKDGVVVFVPVTDKYKGMKAQSFSISSQLEAGLRLQSSPSLDFDSLSENDRLNREAADIIFNIKTE